MNRVRVFRLFAAGGLVFLIGVTYASGLDIPYYADDLQLYFPATGMRWFEHFVRTGPTTTFYRPLQNALLTIIQTSAGMNPLPIHLVTLGLHLVMVGSVYEGGRWLGLSRRGAFLAAAIMGVAQANAAAVLGNDTVSQVGATLFGYLSLRLYGASLQASGSERVRLLLFALCSVLASVLWKETGVAFMIPMLCIEGGMAMQKGRRGGFRSAYGAMGRGGLVLAVGAVYATGRAWAGAMSPGFGPDPYQYHIGMNLIRNVVLFGGAAASMVPTTALARWGQTGAIRPVLASLAVSGGVILVVAYGLYRSRRLRTTGGLLGLAAVTLSPVLLLNDISELYVYAAMPALSLLCGIGIDEMVSGATGWKRAGGLLCIVVVLLVQAGGVYQKSVLMDTTGRRTQAVLGEVVQHADLVPPDGTLCVEGTPSSDTTAYSIYRMPGSLPLQFAGPVLRHLTHRPDLSFSIGRPSCEEAAEAESTLVLHLREGGWGAEPRKAIEGGEVPSAH